MVVVDEVVGSIDREQGGSAENVQDVVVEGEQDFLDDEAAGGPVSVQGDDANAEHLGSILVYTPPECDWRTTIDDVAHRVAIAYGAATAEFIRQEADAIDQRISGRFDLLLAAVADCELGGIQPADYPNLTVAYMLDLARLYAREGIPDHVMAQLARSPIPIPRDPSLPSPWGSRRVVKPPGRRDGLPRGRWLWLRSTSRAEADGRRHRTGLCEIWDSASGRVCGRAVSSSPRNEPVLFAKTTAGIRLAECPKSRE